MLLKFRFLSVLTFLVVSYSGKSQNMDSTKLISNFGGAASVTNNGISFIPTFTLGKPAVIFDMNVGRKLSFEPQFRFALEGKPWSFVFWWRYKAVKTKKFVLNIGTNHTILFTNIQNDSTKGAPSDYLRAQRNITSEISPNFYLTKNISVGVYYLYTFCLEDYLVRNTHYLTFNAGFHNIRLPGQFYLKFYPQVYYLDLDRQNGYYFSTVLTLSRKKFPFSLSTVINKAIQTNISVSKDFAWNISILYAFNRQYVPHVL